MKIAIFVDAFPVWTETFILNQMTGLIDRGHEIEIYASGQRKLDSKHAVIDKYQLIEKTHYLSGQPNNPLIRVLAVFKLLFAEGRWLSVKTWVILFKVFKNRRRALPWNFLDLLTIALPNINKQPHDILHCQFGTLGKRVLFLKEIGALQGKLITSFRGHDVTQKRYAETGFYDALFRQGNMFCPVSRDLGNRLIKLGCPAEKIHVLHSGIDSRKFTFSERKLESNEVPRFVTIARFVEMKGLEYAIKAVARLKQSGIPVSYSIIGDGDLRDELENLIAELQVDDCVHLLGWKSHEDVTNILGNSHILLAPSVTAKNGETEGIPNAVKEAMAMGMPVLSTLHSGLPELVQDGISGFLVPERDDEALANKLKYLIDNPGVWPQMGRKGRAFVEAEFDIEKLNDLLVELYQK